MKILFVDNSCEGHHCEYMACLVQSKSYDSILIIPNYIPHLEPTKQYLCRYNIEKKNPVNYLRFLTYVMKVAAAEKADIIHFLSIDPMIKYFGIGLSRICKQYKIIVTFHHFKYSKLHTIARQAIAHNCTYVVVHTSSLKNVACDEKIKNCIHIEYPNFKKPRNISKEEARRYFDIENDSIPVIGAIGGTRINKGLDILLSALKNVETDFYLLVAGKAEAFDEKYIQNETETYKERIRLRLKYLSDEEVNMAMVASDIIALPYRKSFDGASGPLAEGVTLGKMILSADHGSLGNLVKTNHLGITFQSENISDLSRALEESLKGEWKPDKEYRNYQESLSPEYFLEKYRQLYFK